MRDKLRVLVVTDSLGLPRQAPEVVKFEETWPFLLREHYLVHQVSIGGATISDLVRQLVYHKMFSPDVVIVQAGIVDCAPRALTRFEAELYNRFYITRKILGLVLPKYSSNIRRLRRKTYTPIETFGVNVEKVISIFNSIPIYWIGILKAGIRYEKKVPGIIKNVEKYNKVLESKFGKNFISTNDFPERSIMADHIHLTSFGNNIIYRKIIQRLSLLYRGD